MKRLMLVLPVALVVTGYGYTSALRIYTDEAAFLSDSGPTTVKEDFSTAPLGSVLPGTKPLFGSITFSYLGSLDGGPNEPRQPLIHDQGAINGSREFEGEVNADGTPSGLHFFTMPYDVFSFGGSFDGATSGARLTLEAAGQTVKLSDYLGSPGTGFLGVVSNSPFRTVTFGVEATTNPSINKSSEVFRLDDVQYAEYVPPPPVVVPPTIPLPTTALSLLAGLGLLAGMRRRRG